MIWIGYLEEKAGGPIVLMDSSGWRQDGINELSRQLLGDWWR